MEFGGYVSESVLIHYEYREQLVNLARNQNSLVVVSVFKLLQNSGTHLPQLMNTSSFHQNVGEGNKSLNAMSPDPLLSEAFGKRSGYANLLAGWKEDGIYL